MACKRSAVRSRLAPPNFSFPLEHPLQPTGQGIFGGSIALLCINPLVVYKDDMVRVRVGKPTMTNHPIHMHG
jgi:FtsP/CotA-like multicopper oxidase with cupredoxin domain